MSDVEREPGDAGDVPAPDSAEIEAGAEPVLQPRVFRSWASALEEENKPSLWARMLERFAALFHRPPSQDWSDTPGVADSASEVAFEVEPITGTNEYPAEDVGVESGSEETTFEETDIQASAVQESAAEPSASEARSWLDQPEPAAHETFESVEEALPAAAESASYDGSTPEPFASVNEAQAEPKPGFFNRLFRRSKSAPRPSLEIEIHEDRIAAAADALDVVGEQTFAANQEEPIPSADAFASLQDALPGDERFARPVDSRETVETKSKPEIEAVQPDSRDTVEVPRDDRKAVETTPFFGDTLELVRDKPAVPDPAEFLGETLEVVRDKPDPRDMQVFFGETLEVVPEKRESADSGAYFGDTLEPGHFGEPTEEVDTDEFEVVTPASDTTLPVTPPSGVDEDTAQVSQKSLIERLVFWRAKAKAEAGVDGAATLVEGNAVFLFSKFRVFYNEIIRSKHQKSEFTAGFSTAIVTDYSADLSPDGSAESLSKNLAAMLELQAAEAMWMGGESAERYPDAQYAMAALADETFLHSEWEGQGAWHKNLLEVRLYKTHAADVELFKRIDKLLKDQPNSSAARDLARVYLLVIAAGFRGKYRPFGLMRPLAEYRQRLYEYIHQGGDALMIYAPERRIFPEAAERTVEGEAVARFTSAQRWAAILVFLVVSYTVVAHLAWSSVSADLKDVTDRIIAGSTTAGGGNR